MGAAHSRNADHSRRTDQTNPLTAMIEMARRRASLAWCCGGCRGRRRSLCGCLRPRSRCLLCDCRTRVCILSRPLRPHLPPYLPCPESALLYSPHRSLFSLSQRVSVDATSQGPSKSSTAAGTLVTIGCKCLAFPALQLSLNWRLRTLTLATCANPSRPERSMRQ